MVNIVSLLFWQIYAVSITIRIVVNKLTNTPLFNNVIHNNLRLLIRFNCLLFLAQMGFMMLTAFWKFDFPPFMVLVIAILNDGKNLYIYR